MRGLLYALYFIRGVPETLQVRAQTSKLAVAQVGKRVAAAPHRVRVVQNRGTGQPGAAARDRGVISPLCTLFALRLRLFGV